MSAVRARSSWIFAVVLGGASCGRATSSGSRLEEPLRWQDAPDPAGLTPERPAGDGALPEDTLSVTLTVEGAAADVLSLGARDAAGRTLIDAADPEESRNRMLRGRQLAVAMLPSATASLPLGPLFEVRGRREGEGPAAPLSFAAFIKRTAQDRRFFEARRAPDVQALASTIFLVGERAADPARVDLALGEMGRILRAAGVEVEEPRRATLPGPGSDRFARLEIDPAQGSDTPELGELLALAPAEDGPALAIFVVGDLVVGPGSLPGLSGSVPVPPVGGTPRSGVVVNGLFLDRDPVYGGQVMAHEAGHALGLFHVSEADGIHHDQIDDTGDGDDANLMFWQERPGGDRLSPGQGEILRRAALLR